MPESEAAFRERLAARAASRDPLFHAILDRASGEPLGIASYLRIDPANGVIEVGHLHFGPRLQRTPASTEAMALMMARAFDELGYRRYEWKCDSLNAPSRAAALRLGFTFEGIFRNAGGEGALTRHRVVRDHRRGLAEGPRRLRNVARAGEFRRGRPAATRARGVARGGRNAPARATGARPAMLKGCDQRRPATGPTAFPDAHVQARCSASRELHASERPPVARCHRRDVGQPRRGAGPVQSLIVVQRQDRLGQAGRRIRHQPCQRLRQIEPLRGNRRAHTGDSRGQTVEDLSLHARSIGQGGHA